MTDFVGGNYYLSAAEKHNNARAFAERMRAYGYTFNAICGMLGNIESESGINPGIWQGLREYDGGYGLVQWTPYTKYSIWMEDNYPGEEWLNNGDRECERIDWERINGVQFFPSTEYPMTFDEFRLSTDTPETLAAVFLYNYERPEDPQPFIRQEQARYWYNYLAPDFGLLPIWMYRRRRRFIK